MEAQIVRLAGKKTAQGNMDENDIGDFYYTPPAGYLCLCAANLPTPSIALPGEHFNTKLFTGNNTTAKCSDGSWISARLYMV